MSKNSIGLAAAAIAASSVQALASAPQTTLPERPAQPVIAAPTGLTAADLFVGPDGTIAVDVRAQGATIVACVNRCTINVHCC